MKAHYRTPQPYCECGRAMMLTSGNDLTCINNECEHFGKTFKAPEPEYIELVPTGQETPNG